MALKITYINEQAPSPKVSFGERVYRTTDGTRLVPEGHPDAAFLYCSPGHEVERADFERYELDAALGGVVEASPGEDEPPAESEPEAAEDEEVEEKEVEKPKDKQRRHRGTKAV